MKRVRVAVFQTEHRRTREETLEGIRKLVRSTFRRRGPFDLGLLPEYFFASRNEFFPEETPWAREFLEELSEEVGGAMGGTILEKKGGLLFNVGLLVEGKKVVAFQEKIHPTPEERKRGIVGGDKVRLFRFRGIPLGFLVCSDVLYPEQGRILGIRGARVILVPVRSPSRPFDRSKRARESLFVARAFDQGAFVLKAGGWARGRPPPVVGRSLIASPWGILGRSRGDLWEGALVVDLDLEALEEFRQGGWGLEGRRPEVYTPLSCVPGGKRWQH